MQVSFQSLFATPVFTSFIDDPSLIQTAQENSIAFHEQTEKPLLVSEMWNKQERSADQEDKDTYGITSFGDDQRLFDHQEWLPVADAILNCVKEMLRTAYGDELAWMAKLSNMWLSIYPDGGFIPEHIHSNAPFSGVFYAKAEKFAGDLTLHDPAWVAKSMLHLNNVDVDFIQTKIDIQVETGKVILFPGWLPHSSRSNCSGENRIIIGFNVTFGTKE